MSWMRASIGVGGVGLLAGVVGMLLWINDGSNYFGVAVALASAGFLTLVACVLARVFGSSHGSQDDAFKRGREMGYDSGYLEGRRTAKPVVIPMLRVVGGDKDALVVPPDQQLRGVARDREMRAAARDQEIPVSDLGVSDLEHVDGVRFTPPLLPVWRREAPEHVVGWDRVVAWMRPRRIPLLAGVMSLALLGVFLIGTAMARPSAPVEAQHPSPGPGSLFDRAVPSHGTTPALVPAPADPLALVAGASPLSTTTGDMSPVAPMPHADAVLASVSTSLAGLASAPSNLAGVAVVAPAIDSLPAVTPRSAAPLVAAPVVPLTAAEQTAADALAAANLTKANAAAAADLTAATAKAAADRTAATAAAAAELTAANAAAAAAATAQAAADAAWAVANP